MWICGLADHQTNDGMKNVVSMGQAMLIVVAQSLSRGLNRGAESI